MARFFQIAREEIQRYGGIVEKFIGDAVMAMFGVPVVHEDDAERAARSAASIRTPSCDSTRIASNCRAFAAASSAW